MFLLPAARSSSGSKAGSSPASPRLFLVRTDNHAERGRLLFFNGGYFDVERAREQAIRERAYFIWVREGRRKGRDIANWLEAEAEINQPCNDVGGFVRSWADALAAGHRIQDC